MKKGLLPLITLAVFLTFTSLTFASTITINVNPSQVPDENFPLVNYGDAPVGFGPDSWQNSAINKVNWHARYLQDGDYLSALFPTQATTLTIDDIADISYWTKRPNGTEASQDWAVFIYTRPFTGGDSSWYGNRFVNDYNTHTALNDWNQYSISSGMQFKKNSGTTTALMDFSDLKSTYGDQLVEMISVQTMSNYDDFNGFMDGLTITLTDGSIGKVDFGPVPEPATMLLFGIGLLGIAGVSRRKMA